MKNWKKPLAWGTVTLVTVLAEKYLLPGIMDENTSGRARKIVYMIGSNNIAKTLEFIVNPILGATTFGSMVRNWAPGIYKAQRENNRKKWRRRQISAAVLGLVLTFPYQALYVAEKVISGIRSAPSPCYGQAMSLSQIAKEHGPIHKKTLDEILSEEKYAPLRNNPYFRSIHFSVAMESVESDGNPCAKGEDGEEGLMQLSPRLIAEYGVRNARDKEQNIEAGVRHFANLSIDYTKRGFSHYETALLGLSAYNTGPLNVDSALGKVKPKDRNYDTIKRYLDPRTVRHVSKVIARYNKLQGTAGARQGNAHSRDDMRDYRLASSEFVIGPRHFYLPPARL